jgi:hypothetical protein
VHGGAALVVREKPGSRSREKESLAGAAAVWTIAAPPGQRRKSPVDHGVVPEGAIGEAPATALEAGGQYEVLLAMEADGESYASLEDSE